MSLGQRLFLFRERFKNMDRKWHILIGSQLIFGMFLFRVNKQNQLRAEKSKEESDKRR
jgi:hypothetical protein